MVKLHKKSADPPQHQDIADDGGAVFSDVLVIFLSIDVVFRSPGGDPQPLRINTVISTALRMLLRSSARKWRQM